MSRESLVVLLGVIIFFVPSLGIPNEWKTYLISGCGVLLMIIGYTLRRAAFFRSIEGGDGVRRSESFVESRGRTNVDVPVTPELE